jgi:hypothetical protein
MKFELPDNAREAFQFLAFGVGIVLAIRLVVAGFGLWSGQAADDALAEACAPFRSGYPLIGNHTLVVGGLPMIPRLAIAGLFALLSGALLALLAWPIGKTLNLRGARALVVGGRLGLLLGGAWAIYCLLCLPAERAEVKQKEIVLHSQAAFFGEIPWPIPGSEEHRPLVSVDQFFINSHPMDKDLVVVAYAAGDMFTIARAPSGTSHTGVLDEQWNQDAERLVAALNALPR